MGSFLCVLTIPVVYTALKNPTKLLTACQERDLMSIAT